jgi:hypothetical protein
MRRNPVGADNPVHIRSARRRARLKEHRSGSTYGHVLLLLDAGVAFWSWSCCAAGRELTNEIELLVLRDEVAVLRLHEYEIAA